MFSIPWHLTIFLFFPVDGLVQEIQGKWPLYMQLLKGLPVQAVTQVLLLPNMKAKT
jgi:hypothetical protein